MHSLEKETMESKDVDAPSTESCCTIVREEIFLPKWRILLVACIMPLGVSYMYDFPSSIGSGSGATIEHKFRTHGKEYTQTMNQALYSVYNWPNTVMAIVGGLLIDKILGLRRATLLFATMIAVGSAVFYFGVLSTSYALMVVGRTVFGLGGDSLGVSQSAFISRWFKGGRGMALAFGIALSMSRVGSSFNFLISPPAASRWGIDAAVLLGVVTCVVSFACAAALVAMDVYGTRRSIVPPESKETSTPFRFSDVKRFPLLLWMTFLVCVCGFWDDFNFYWHCRQLLPSAEWPQPRRCIVLRIVLSVRFGIRRPLGWRDGGRGRPPHRVALRIFFDVCAISRGASHCDGPPSSDHHRWCCVLSHGCRLWPMVPIIVDESLLGLAFGFMTAFLDGGLALLSPCVGAVLDAYTPSSNSTNATITWNLGLGNETAEPTEEPTPLPTMRGFMWVEVILLVVASLTFLFTTVVYWLDRRGACLLSVSPAQRKKNLETKARLIN